MTYRGIVKNGVVVLGETADLPDGTEVRVERISGGACFPYIWSEDPTFSGRLSGISSGVTLNGLRHHEALRDIGVHQVHRAAVAGYHIVPHTH